MHRSILPIILVCTLTLLVFTPTLTLAQFTPDGVDTVIRIDNDGSVTMQGDTRMTLVTEDPGVRYVWTFDHPFDAVIEFRFDPRTFDVDRPKQVVPLLEAPERVFPLFHFLSGPDVWNTDAPAYVYNHSHDGATTVLRVQIPQTPDATLTLQRDTTPPAYSVGEVERLERNSFYQETTTDEFSLAELQWRANGSTDPWVPNPTPAFNTLHRFPIIGLDPDTEYDVRVVFTDWAGNLNITNTYNVQTLARGPPPTFAIVSPQPEARSPAGEELVIEARIETGDAEVEPGSVRLFVNLEEVHDGFTFEDGVLTHRITDPAVGHYVVAVQAETTEGGTDDVRWRFTVGDPQGEPQEAPLVPVLVLITSLLLVLHRARRPPAC